MRKGDKSFTKTCCFGQNHYEEMSLGATKKMKSKLIMVAAEGEVQLSSRKH